MSNEDTNTSSQSATPTNSNNGVQTASIAHILSESPLSQIKIAPALMKKEFALKKTQDQETRTQIDVDNKEE